VIATEVSTGLAGVPLAQVTVVSDAHELVVHSTTLPENAEIVGSLTPKFKPSTVTEAPPLRGLLMRAALTAGLSSEKPLPTNVPTSALTVN